MAANPKIVEKGFQRVEDAVSGIPYEEGDPMTDITTFIAACLLLHTSKARVIAGKFALKEAIRMEGHLAEDRKSGITAYILGYLFDTEIRHTENRTLIPIANYVRRCHRYGDKSWKLVNMMVEGGMVHVEPKQARRTGA